MENEERQLKVVLYGPSGSGKTTLYRQLRFLQQQKFDESFYSWHRRLIVLNLVDCTKGVLDQFNTEAIEQDFLLYDAKELFQHLSSMFKGLHGKVPDGVTFGDHVDEDMFDSLAYLWTHESFQEKLQSFPGEVYEVYKRLMVKLYNQYPNWGGRMWKLDDDDILTTGFKSRSIEKSIVQYKGVRIEVVDFPGDRRPHVQMLSDVDGVFFVTGADSYDEFRTSEYNGFGDSLHSFEKLFAEFDRPLMCFLVLNKTDLFQRKLIQQEIPLNESGHFPDAPTMNINTETALEFLANQHIVRVKPTVARNVNVFFLDALDRAKCQQVLDDAFHSLLNVHP